MSAIAETEMVDQWLWLFSSNRRALYAQDVSNILGLPMGARYQFRYRKKWASDDALSAWQENSSSLVEKSGSIIFSYQHDKHFHPPAFFPCRDISVINAEVYGSFLIVEFIVGRYLTLPSDQEKLDTDYSSMGRQAQNFSREVENRLENGHPSPDPELNKSTVLGPSSVDLVDNLLLEPEAWERTIKYLSASGAFDGHLFYRIEGLMELSSQEYVPIDSHRWNVIAGNTYILEVLHYSPDPLPHLRYLDVIVDGTVLEIQGPNKVTISSGYDRVRVVFNAIYRDEPKDAVVTIQPADGQRGTLVNLPIRVLPPRAEKAKRTVFGSIPIFGAVFPGLWAVYNGGLLAGMLVIAGIGALITSWLSLRSRIRLK